MIRERAMVTVVTNECTCKTTGLDDGAITCLVHHDCSTGMCTHQEISDDYDDSVGPVDASECE